MSVKVQPRSARRQFKVHVERSDNDAYTATIAPIDDARDFVADKGLDSGIIDLVSDILIEIAREDEEPPDGHD
jgi:hypothetical protein